MEPKRALLALLMFLGELRLRAGAGNRVSWPAMKTLMGRSPEVTVRDLTPGAKYTLAAEMTDAVLRVWRSESTFRPSRTATVLV